MDKTIHWIEPDLNYPIIPSLGSDYYQGGRGDDTTQTFPGWYGYKITNDSLPYIQNSGLQKGEIISCFTQEYDGAYTSGQDQFGYPIIDNSSTGFEKINLVGYDYAEGANSQNFQDNFGTWIEVKKNSNSGTIINVGSTQWTSDSGIGGPDSLKIRLVTKNMIEYLLGIPDWLISASTQGICGNTNICSRDSTELNAFDGVKFLWNTGDTLSSIVVAPDTTTTYSVLITQAKGFQITEYITVAVSESSYDTLVITACDSVEINSIVYTSSGEYVQTFTNAMGCDSVLVLELTISESSYDTLAITACDSVEINSIVYTSSGEYVQTFTNAMGCDSVLVIELTILESSYDTLAIAACDSVEINSVVYNSSGEYIQTFTNAMGCDSVLVLELTISESSYDTLGISACDSVEINSIVYTSSGEYIQTFTNAMGCDSVLVLELTISESSYDTLAIAACDSVEINSVVYNSSGEYIQTFTNAMGCDSVLVLELTISESSYDTLGISACDSVEINSIVYTSSGEYVQTFANAMGCDSVLVLELTISESSYDTLAITACDSVEINSIVYASSGEYVQTFTNAMGCDSMLVLELTISESSYDTLAITACDSFIYNSSVYKVSGNYLLNFQSSSGCDSLILLNLIIIEKSSAGLDIVACKTPVLMNAELPQGATGTWTKISGSGIIVSPNSPGTLVKNISTGITSIFEWQVNSSTCISRDTMTITRISPPNGITVNSFGLNWVTFSWNSIDSPDSFTAKIVENCTSTGGFYFKIPGNLRSYTFTGIKGCTNYCIKLKAECSDESNTSFSQAAQFTSGGPTPCVAAKGFTITHTQNCTHNVSWKKTCVSADSFRVQYKLSSTSQWSSTVWTAGTNKNVQLSAGNWNIRVQSKCGSTVYTTASTTYNVGSCRMEGVFFENFSNIQLFPNPTTDRSLLNFTSFSVGDYRITVKDISGRTQRTINGIAVEGENTAEINVNGLSKGMYLIGLTLNGETRQVKLAVE